MSELQIVDFSKLDPYHRTDLGNRANWRIDDAVGNWTHLTDPEYGVSIRHVAVVKNGIPVFDKIDITHTRQGGIFVLPMRISTSGLAEFALVKENRILLVDENGEQGKMFIYNLPQGGVQQNETLNEAATREAGEETGEEIKDLILLGRVGIDIANSRELAPFFLGFVDANGVNKGQTLDNQKNSHEVMEKAEWFNWQQIQEIDTPDSKTLVALYLAQRVVHLNLLGLTELNPSSRPLNTPIRISNDPTETLDEFIRVDRRTKIQRIA